MEVRAEAVLTEVDGRKLRFEITAYDEAGEIGKATHERVIIKAERFLEKTYDKL
jgi:predicted thioesterase